MGTWGSKRWDSYHISIQFFNPVWWWDMWSGFLEATGYVSQCFGLIDPISSSNISQGTNPILMFRFRCFFIFFPGMIVRVLFADHLLDHHGDLFFCWGGNKSSPQVNPYTSLSNSVILSSFKIYKQQDVYPPTQWNTVNHETKQRFQHHPGSV